MLSLRLARREDIDVLKPLMRAAIAELLRLGYTADPDGRSPLAVFHAKQVSRVFTIADA